MDVNWVVDLLSFKIQVFFFLVHVHTISSLWL